MIRIPLDRSLLVIMPRLVHVIDKLTKGETSQISLQGAKVPLWSLPTGPKGCAS
jgi:hypothetical protein